VTCSVFRKENEEVVDFIKRQTNFSLIEMRLLKGYEEKADTMFAALFRLI
jgi:16S rRNA (cytosine967-C5)-methyltransferase